MTTLPLHILFVFVSCHPNIFESVKSSMFLPELDGQNIENCFFFSKENSNDLLRVT